MPLDAGETEPLPCLPIFGPPATDGCELYVEADAVESDYVEAGAEPRGLAVRQFEATIDERTAGVREWLNHWRTVFSYSSEGFSGELVYSTPKPWVIAPLPETVSVAYLSLEELCGGAPHTINGQSVLRTADGELLILAVRELTLRPGGLPADNAGLTPELRISWEEPTDCPADGRGQPLAMRFESTRGSVAVRPGQRAALEIGGSCYEILVSRAFRPSICGSASFAIVRQDLLARCPDGGTCS